MENSQLIEQLTEAVADLLWLSEADYPWQVIWLPEAITDLNCQTLLQYYNYPPTSKIITTTVDSFLASAVVKQEWYDEAETIQAQRYHNLWELLQENLQDIQVYLVGETEIDVYLLGVTEYRTIVGISTKIVET